MDWKESKLIGRRVYFQDYDGDWNDWGIVIGYDGDYYHVAPAGAKNISIVLSRREMRVPRRKDGNT